MTIGGQRKLLQLREKHLLRFADRMELPREYVINRFTGLVKTLPDAFDQATEENRHTPCPVESTSTSSIISTSAWP